MACLEVGTYAHLKNFRKGLNHQLARSTREWKEAQEAGDDATAAACTERMRWIHEKQASLDGHHVMLTDALVYLDDQPYMVNDTPCIDDCAGVV